MAKYILSIIALAAAALMVTACGSGPTAHVTGSPSTMPVSGATAKNKLVCQHYLRQYAWNQHLTFPTAADAVKWLTYVSVDGIEAAPGTKLSHDLNDEVKAMSGTTGVYKNGTVYRDCLSLAGA